MNGVFDWFFWKNGFFSVGCLLLDDVVVDNIGENFVIVIGNFGDCVFGGMVNELLFNLFFDFVFVDFGIEVIEFV